MTTKTATATTATTPTTRAATRTGRDTGSPPRFFVGRGAHGCNRPRELSRSHRSHPYDADLAIIVVPRATPQAMDDEIVIISPPQNGEPKGQTARYRSLPSSRPAFSAAFPPPPLA